MTLVLKMRMIPSLSATNRGSSMREAVIKKSGMQPRDKWIPYYFVLFFVVVCSVDGVMAYFAITTRTGVVTEHYYERGLHYNDTIADANKQDVLGWGGEIRFVPSPDSVVKGDLHITLNDRQAKSIDGAKVTASIIRPTQDGHDVVVTLQPSKTGGYSAPVTFPMQGQWDIEIAAVRGNDKFQLNKRLVIR
jgi:nitrogen fixation protein FixH